MGNMASAPGQPKRQLDMGILRAMREERGGVEEGWGEGWRWVAQEREQEEEEVEEWGEAGEEAGEEEGRMGTGRARTQGRW